ncbi:MAG: SocA family protein [Demequinaceae bacterium]|nr:SocA family protein [Demequinaceae bacterium]
MDARAAVAAQPRFNETKFAELMLYVAKKMECSPSYGATILNKVLFYSDFRHYEVYGSSITGAEYRRREFGPAPHKLLPVRDGLVESGRAALATKSAGPNGHQQVRLEAVGEPDLSRFTGTEIAVVDEVIEWLWDQTAVSASNRSHEFLGWQLVEPNDPIPYQMVFLRKTPVTDSDRETARHVEKLVVAAHA